MLRQLYLIEIIALTFVFRWLYYFEWMTKWIVNCQAQSSRVIMLLPSLKNWFITVSLMRYSSYFKLLLQFSIFPLKSCWKVDRDLVEASMNEALRNCLARNADVPSVSGQVNLINDYGNHFNQILSVTSSTTLSLDDSPPCSSPVPPPISPVHVS